MNKPVQNTNVFSVKCHHDLQLNHHSLFITLQRRNDVKDIGGESCDVKINLNADDSNDNGHNNHFSHRNSPQIHTNNNRRYGQGHNSNEATHAELQMSMLW